MPSAGNVLTTTAGMGATGFMVGGPVGAAIGGFVGLLGSLFGGGKSAEEIMAERKIAAQKAIAAAYAKKRADLSLDTREAVSRAEQGAARRALSTGRTATAGDVAGATGQVYAEGGRALRGLQEAEAEQLAAIEAGYAARPIEEDMPLSDVLMSLGSSAASIAMNAQYTKTLDAQRAAADKVATSQIAPSETTLDQSGVNGGVQFAPPTLVQPPSKEAVPVMYNPSQEVQGGVENVMAALETSRSPYAQGPAGARQGLFNRMNNQSRSKTMYGGLMQQLSGRYT